MKKNKLYVFAGPNGSGKSTITSNFVSYFLSNNIIYVNADIIAQEIFSDIEDEYDRNLQASKVATNLRNTLIKDIRNNLKGVNPDMLMLSEYDYNNMTGYSWDSQWNLDLRSAFQVFITGELMSGQTYNTTVSSLKNVMTRSLYKLPRQQSLTIQNLISYHDADRIYIDSAAGRSSALVQMTYLGAPVIYYGQEIGLDRETENGVSQSGHAATSFHSMNWNEEDWDYDMLSFYQTLGGIRKDYTALKTGAVEDIVCDDSKGLLGFARYDKNGAVITMANRGNEIDQYEISVSKFGLKDGSVVTDCFSGKKYIVINGKKICGILSESYTAGEGMDFVVTGIGINCDNEKFEGELETIATSVMTETGDSTLLNKDSPKNTSENFACTGFLGLNLLTNGNPTIDSSVSSI